MIMRAEKSHDLQSASWRAEKASGIILVQVQRPEHGESQLCESQSEGEGPRTKSVDVPEKVDVSAPAEWCPPPTSASLFSSGLQGLGAPPILVRMILLCVCVCVCLPFLGPIPWHTEVPRLGVQSEL